MGSHPSTIGGYWSGVCISVCAHTVCICLLVVAVEITTRLTGQLIQCVLSKLFCRYLVWMPILSAFRQSQRFGLLRKPSDFCGHMEVWGQMCHFNYLQCSKSPLMYEGIRDLILVGLKWHKYNLFCITAVVAFVCTFCLMCVWLCWMHKQSAWLASTRLHCQLQ